MVPNSTAALSSGEGDAGMGHKVEDGQGQEDEEEDYMSMTFDQPETTAAKPVSSLQRRQQQKREAEARSRPKSKAQLAEEEAAAREAALSTSMLEQAAARKSKGLAMMARMGFKAGSALGAEGNAEARREPIGIEVKEDRGGVGMESEKRRKLKEAFEEAEREAGPEKKRKVEDPGVYRDRMARGRERERTERMVGAAQRVAEGMAEEEEGKKQQRQHNSTDHDGDGTAAAVASTPRNSGDDETEMPERPSTSATSSRPLKSVNVLWRGLVRQREERDRDARMRKDLEQSSLSRRLPTYEDEDEDEDDKRALGKGKGPVYVTAEDLDEEDPELEAFEALEPDEKLGRLVAFLREEWHYCFWCKAGYPDETMEGCPGLTEEDHD